MSNKEIAFSVFKGSENGTITPGQTTKGPLQGDQVLVGITASGVCGTDMHYLSADVCSPESAVEFPANPVFR